MSKPRLYYRQKILLALSEVFDEPLEAIDFMKLLFLLCKEHGKGFYSFFPYRYGCFSSQAYQDWHFLQNNAFMCQGPQFQCSKDNLGIRREIKKADYNALLSIREKYAGLRGQALIRQTYLEYPEYTLLSEIKDRVLTAQEIKTVEVVSGKYPVPVQNRVFTIGYESISIDEYLHRLVLHGVQVLCDVRFTPRSMKYDFNAARLAESLRQIGVEYRGIPSLGIPPELRKELDSEQSYEKLFSLYESKILPKEKSQINEIGEMMQNGKRMALACFEKNPGHCHRSRLAALLSKQLHLETMNI
ncbi:MAG: DUF488 domain-containing protein [Lentisphaerae bacterium]|nr:DUF488 domain-containing protein [Lentisphaerota bacterium]